MDSIAQLVPNSKVLAGRQTRCLDACTPSNMVIHLPFMRQAKTTPSKCSSTNPANAKMQEWYPRRLAEMLKNSLTGNSCILPNGASSSVYGLNLVRSSSKICNHS